MSEYTEQAERFAKKVGLKMKVLGYKWIISTQNSRFVLSVAENGGRWIFIRAGLRVRMSRQFMTCWRASRKWTLAILSSSVGSMDIIPIAEKRRNFTGPL